MLIAVTGYEGSDYLRVPKQLHMTGTGLLIRKKLDKQFDEQ